MGMMSPRGQHEPLSEEEEEEEEEIINWA